MNKIFKVLFMLSALSLLCFAQAKQTNITKDIVELNEEGAGNKVGTVTVTETANGTSISVLATSLKVDAIQVELHLYGKNSPKPTKDKSGNLVIGGGLGEDMENLGYLMVDADGSVNQAIECGLKHSDLKGKSLVITEDVSGYTDNTQTKGEEPLYVAIF